MKKGIILMLIFFIALIVNGEERQKEFKVTLPDGVYMYDSILDLEMKSHIAPISFEKVFFVIEGKIYTEQNAVKKYGAKKLNERYGGKKKYKIVLNGEKVGEITDVVIGEGGVDDYRVTLLKKDIKEGPGYRSDQDRRIIKEIVVPEEYEEMKMEIIYVVNKNDLENTDKIVEQDLDIRNKIIKKMKYKKQIKNYKITSLSVVKINNNSEFDYIATGSLLYEYENDSEGAEIIFTIKKNEVSIVAIVGLVSANTNFMGVIDIGNDKKGIIIKEIAGFDDGDAILEDKMYIFNNKKWETIDNGGKIYEYK